MAISFIKRSILPWKNSRNAAYSQKLAMPNQDSGMTEVVATAQEVAFAQEVATIQDGTEVLTMPTTKKLTLLFNEKKRVKE